MKLSRTEEVVAKQLYSLRQQNKVEGLFIDAASVLDTIFQAKKMEQFYPPFPKKALTLPWLWQEDQPPEKTTQSCNAAKKRHLSPCVHL